MNVAVALGVPQPGRLGRVPAQMVRDPLEGLHVQAALQGEAKAPRLRMRGCP